MHILKELPTKSLILKPLIIDYAEDYARHFIDYRVIRYLSDAVPWPYPKHGIKDFIQNIIVPQQGTERFCYGLFLKTNSQILIGCIDLWREPKPENRGFWLGYDYWGNGYMTEACREINRLAFEDLGFNILYFSNAVDNQRSSRIKQKTGARFLKRIPASFVDPNMTQAELWELCKLDWEKNL